MAMSVDVKPDVRAALTDAFSKLDPEVVKSLTDRTHIVTEVLGQVAGEIARREAMQRERDEKRLEIAALRDQLRGTEAALSKPHKRRSEFADLKEADRLTAQRDELRGKIAGFEDAVAYLESQLAAYAD